MTTPGLIGRLLIAMMVAAPGAWAQSTTPSADDPVRAIAQAIKDANKSYLGWRVFEANCARCHGADAAGGATAPNLLVRIKTTDREGFAATVLRRYPWVLPPGEASGGSGAHDALLEALIQRQQGALDMPAWGDEPAVKAHVIDLYDYLRARAGGTLGPGRPPALTP